MMVSTMVRRGVYLGPVTGGLALFAMVGLLWWAWPRWWSAYVLLLGLPAFWLVFIAPVRSMDSFRRRIRETVVSKAPPGEGALVLDAETGGGLVAAAYAKAAPRVSVVGLDAFRSAFFFGNSPAHAISNAVAEGVREKVRLVRGSVKDIPFGDATFDLVVCSLAVYGIRSRRAFEEMARVVKPGGRFVYVDFVALSVQERMMDELGRLGLVRREEFDAPLDVHAWVFEKERELTPDAPRQI